MRIHIHSRQVSGVRIALQEFTEAVSIEKTECGEIILFSPFNRFVVKNDGMLFKDPFVPGDIFSEKEGDSDEVITTNKT